MRIARLGADEPRRKFYCHAICSLDELKSLGQQRGTVTDVGFDTADSTLRIRNRFERGTRKGAMLSAVRGSPASPDPQPRPSPDPRISRSPPRRDPCLSRSPPRQIFTRQIPASPDPCLARSPPHQIPASLDPRPARSPPCSCQGALTSTLTTGILEAFFAAMPTDYKSANVASNVLFDPIAPEGNHMCVKVCNFRREVCVHPTHACGCAHAYAYAQCPRTCTCICICTVPSHMHMHMHMRMHNTLAAS